MLERDDIKKLFIILQARYGHKWTTAYDDPDIMRAAVDEWYNELRGFMAEDLKKALSSWGDAWPPSLPELATMCLPSIEEMGIDIQALVATRLPRYKFEPQNGFEEGQRRILEIEITGEVMEDIRLNALEKIRKDGVQAVLVSDQRRLQ